MFRKLRSIANRIRIRLGLAPKLRFSTFEELWANPQLKELDTDLSYSDYDF